MRAAGRHLIRCVDMVNPPSRLDADRFRAQGSRPVVGVTGAGGSGQWSLKRLSPASIRTASTFSGRGSGQVACGVNAHGGL